MAHFTFQNVNYYIGFNIKIFAETLQIQFNVGKWEHAENKSQ